ncbi:O-antigen ligase family protein [Williamsia sp. 1135]|uniref:O-antigen ligase family protein n=1 Tax=Williamsia sp. 1135 TaxID=1889262 RepID=UPI000A0F74DF|nr:O-antigen ligase family protein [Williamsia sp. 1135]ORM37596.1 hypothetical protein BFL43_03680 [Williamsia sp. 1135]
MTTKIRTAEERSARAGPALAANDLAWFLIGTGLALIAAITQLGPRISLLLIVPVGVALGVYAMRRPLVTLLLLVVAETVNLAGVVALHVSLPVFPASLALGLLTIALALRDPGMRARLNRWTVVFAGLICVYLATQAVAIMGSVELQESIWTIRRILLDCVFLMIVFVLAQFTARPWTVAVAVVVPLAVLSLLAVVNELVFAGGSSFFGFSTVTEASGELTTTLRYGGPLPDSNFWGRNLVMGLPLACALIHRSVRSRDTRAATLWGASVLALLAGIYLTQSRGTFVAAAAGLIVWIVLSGPTVRKWSLLAFPLMGLMFFVPGIGNRLTALYDDVFGENVDYGIDPSILGRKAAQEIAWAMFDDRPIYGFGPGTYYTQVPEYAGTVQTAVVHPTDAPHNLYAQLAAESGIVGLTGWLVMVIGIVGLLALRLYSNPSVRDRVLMAAAVAAVAAWSVASIFLHLAYFRSFALILALAGAMGAAGGPFTAEATRGFARGVAVTITAAVAGVLAAGAVLWSTTTTETTATQELMLLPPGTSTDDGYGYALDIRSRSPVLPTYAAIMRSAEQSATVTADPVRGVVTISRTDPDAATAREGLRADVDLALERIREVDADSDYSIVDVGLQMTSEPTHSGPATAVAVLIGAAVAVGVGLTIRRFAGESAGVRRRTRAGTAP